MAEMTIDAFKNTLDTLISSNAHARNKGDDFKDWCIIDIHNNSLTIGIVSYIM